MATIRLAPDFKEFLQLLNSGKIEYLVVGGYALGYYGHPRATGDIDIWVAIRPDNADRLVAALQKFGFGPRDVVPDMFLREKQVIRMGVPPLRIELFTTISGVDFATCYARRTRGIVDGIDVNFINLDDFKSNKRAAARVKDLSDLEQLGT